MHHIKSELTNNDALIPYSFEDMSVDAGDLVLVPYKGNLEIGTVMSMTWTTKEKLNSEIINNIYYNISKEVGSKVLDLESNLELIGFKKDNFSMFKFIDIKEKLEMYIDLHSSLQDINILEFSCNKTKKNSFIISARGTYFKDIANFEFIVTYIDYLDAIILYGDIINLNKKIRLEIDRAIFNIDKFEKIKKNLKIIK